MEKEKRFIFNPEVESEKRRRAVQEAFYKVREEFPECVGLTFFGSLVKGYDNSESDVDLYVYIDPSKSQKEDVRMLEDSANPNRKKANMVWMDKTIKERQKEIGNKFISFLDSSVPVNFGFEFISDRTAFFYPMSESYIDERLESFKKVLEKSQEITTEAIKTMVLIEHLAHLFCVGIGELDIYRSYLIRKLQAMDKEGGIGSRIWKFLMSSLNKLETITEESKQPRLEEAREGKSPHPDMTKITLDQAEDYFCRILSLSKS